MANIWIYIGAAVSIAGAVIAAKPTLISNAVIEKKTDGNWRADDKFEDEEDRDGMKSTRLHAGIGVALAVLGQIISLIGS